MLLANVYIHALSIYTYTHHYTYTYSKLFCMYTTTYLYCYNSPSFHVNDPLLHIYHLQQNTLQIDCLHVHVADLWLFDGCPILSNSMDFHNGPVSAIVWIFIMALIIYDTHIVNLHMDPAWSVALCQSYFTHLDCLVVCCWIKVILLHPTIIILVGTPNT